MKANKDNAKQVRLLDTTLDKVDQYYKSRNEGSNRLLLAAVEAIKLAQAELRRFNKNELTAILQSFNGTIVSPDMARKWAMVHQLQDAERLEGLSSSFGIDFPILMGKVEEINPAAFPAIFEIIHIFWNEGSYITLEAFLEKCSQDATSNE